jgi:hypothetical protein
MIFFFFSRQPQSDIDDAAYGMDDDDTDASDVAGRYAWNHANNLLELVDHKMTRALKLCPFWPRADYAKCHDNALRCLLERLATGEYADHLKLVGKCDDGDDAGEDAFSQRREVFFYARSKGGAAKKLCNHKDDVDADPCKNNVECRFLEGVAKKFPTVVTLTNCTTMVEPPARNA